MSTQRLLPHQKRDSAPSVFEFYHLPMVGAFSAESREPILLAFCAASILFETYRVQLQYGSFENLFLAGSHRAIPQFNR